MAQLAEALEDAVIEDDELSMIAAPTIAGFTFDSFSVRKIGSVQTERITDGPFAGLYSLTQIVEIHSEAADAQFNSSAIIQPRDPGDGTLEKNAKFAWKADWHIELDLSRIAVGSEAADLCAKGITHTRASGSRHSDHR